MGFQTGLSVFQWDSTGSVKVRLMDKVFVKGLSVEAVIGVYDWEREIRQRLLFDLEMSNDNRVPAASDNVEDTLDYDRISRRIAEFTGESEFQLIETLAERVAELVLAEFAVSHLKLTLHKPGAVDIADDVGVSIERSA